MISFILRRLMIGVVLVFAVSTVAYFLMYLTAGNVAQRILGATADQAAIDNLTAQLGLNAPIVQRYGGWLLSALRGDFGYSWFTSEPVLSGVLSRLPVTLSLVIGTTIVSAILAFALGLVSAVRRGWLDRLLQVLSIVGFSLPPFLIGLLLVITLAINVPVFPATGYVPFADAPAGWFATVTLPITALAVGAVAATAQQVRSATIDVLQLDWVRTLRSRGLASWDVLLFHVFRSSAGTGVTVLGLQFVGLLGGVVIVEQIFALPGIGQIAVSATLNGDVPMIMGLVVVTAIVVVIVNLLFDLVVAWLNPKVRLS